MSLCAYYEGSFSTMFEERGEKTFTEVTTNKFIGQGHPLFVVAVHTNTFKHVKGINNGVSLIPLGKVQNSDKISPDDILDIYDIAGKFKLTRRQKGTKLPVVHFNKTRDKINALYVNCQLLSTKDSDDKWTTDKVDKLSFFWKSRKYSSCNNFVSSMLVGFFKFGDILSRTWSSYSTLKMPYEGVESSIPWELCDFLVGDLNIKLEDRIVVRPSLVTVNYMVTMRGLIPIDITVMRNEGSIKMEVENFGLSDEIGQIT